MSGFYPDLANSIYPENYDTFANKKDADANTAKIIAQYKARFNNGNYTQAQTILTNNPGLADYMITADDFNKLQDAIMAVQRYQAREQRQIVFSDTQPSGSNAQAVGDIWMQTTANGARMWELTASGYSERKMQAETGIIDAQINDLSSTVKNIEDNRQLKTYTSFEQLGLSVTRDSRNHLTTAPTLQQVFEKMPNYSTFIYLTNRDTDKLADFWVFPPKGNGEERTNGYIELTRIQSGRARLVFWCTEDDQMYISTFSGGNPNDYTWKRAIVVSSFDFNASTGTLNITL